MTKINYVNPNLLDKEVILSKFKGYPTEKYKEYIWLMSFNLGTKLNRIFNNSMDDNYDCYMTSYMDALVLYKGIKDGYPSFAYITECMKRSYVKGKRLQKFGKYYMDKDILEVKIINDPFI